METRGTAAHPPVSKHLLTEARETAAHDHAINNDVTDDFTPADHTGVMRLFFFAAGV